MAVAPNGRRFVRAAGLLLFAQLIFWAVVALAESLSRPPTINAPDSVTLYLTAEGRTRGDKSPITIELNADPLYDYKDESADPSSTIGVFHSLFNVGQRTDGLGVYFSSAYGIDEVRLNGRLIKAASPTDPQGTLSGFGPVAFVFPNEFVRLGTNTLEIRSSGRTYKALPLHSVGLAAEALVAQRWGQLFAFDLVIAATAMMIFVLVFCLLVRWPAPEQARIRALVLLLGTWSLRNLSILGLFDPLPLPLMRIATYTANFLPMIALAVLAIRWTDLGQRLLKLETAAYVAAVAVPIALVAFDWRVVGGTSVPWLLDNALTLAATLFALTLFTRYANRAASDDHVEVLLFVIATTALLVDKLDNLVHLTVPFSGDLYLTFYAAPMFGLVLAVGMCASIAAQATRARMAEMSLNQRLADKLAASEARIREQAKRSALIEERRRIMQDMHDGLGAQLTALVAEASNLDVPRRVLAADISRSIDELRLMVDSLDTEGDSLAIALGAFRGRIEPALKAAGIELVWAIELNDDIALTVQGVLDVFRILQASCANVIAHSDATTLTISMRRTNEYVELAVMDNGRGLTLDSTEHKGMTNMRDRARRLGGKLAVESASSGLTVRLTLPLRKAC
ncbi:MAG: ATP-binding protein [Pseudomonadota bacterium]